jgi:hypothetical protein
VTDATEYSTPEAPRAVAIVILPFLSEEDALTFANLVRGKGNGQTAIVTRGSVYEYVVDVTKEAGQIIEFEGDWEGPYVDSQRPNVLIIQREQH